MDELELLERQALAELELREELYGSPHVDRNALACAPLKSDLALAEMDAPKLGMVALYPDHSLAGKLALPGGEPPDDLHMTLVFLGPVEDIPNYPALEYEVAAWAAHTPPIEGEISGYGKFVAGPKPVTYASVDAPKLPEQRQYLWERVLASGHKPPDDHGFTPHITLDYDSRRPPITKAIPVRFTQVVLKLGRVSHTFPLLGKVAEAQHVSGYTYTRDGKVIRVAAYVRDDPVRSTSELFSGLQHGEQVALPDGWEVEKVKGGGYMATPTDSPHLASVHPTATAAAIYVLGASARATHPKSLGGKTAYPGGLDDHDLSRKLGLEPLEEGRVWVDRYPRTRYDGSVTWVDAHWRQIADIDPGELYDQVERLERRIEKARRDVRYRDDVTQDMVDNLEAERAALEKQAKAGEEAMHRAADAEYRQHVAARRKAIDPAVYVGQDHPMSAPSQFNYEPTVRADDGPEWLTLSAYTDRSSGGINAGLRAADPKVLEHQVVQRLDGLFAKQPPLMGSYIVWRGGLLSDAPKVGDVVQDRAYVSTSWNRKTAEGKVPEGGVLMQVRVPAGARVVDVSSALGSAAEGAAASEREVLLPRNQRFRVVEVHDDHVVVQWVLGRPGADEQVVEVLQEGDLQEGRVWVHPYRRDGMTVSGYWRITSTLEDLANPQNKTTQVAVRGTDQVITHDGERFTLAGPDGTTTQHDDPAELLRTGGLAPPDRELADDEVNRQLGRWPQEKEIQRGEDGLPIADIDELYAQAEVAQVELEDLLIGGRGMGNTGGFAADELHGANVEEAAGRDQHEVEAAVAALPLDHPAVVVGELKKRERVTKKLKGKPYGPEGLTDLVRATISVPTLDQLPATLRAFEDYAKAKGWELVHPDNSLTTEVGRDGGYRDLSFNMVAPSGHKVEMQFTVAHLLHIKFAKVHDIYNEMRDLQDKSKVEPLTAEETAHLHALEAEAERLQVVAYDEALLAMGAQAAP